MASEDVIELGSSDDEAEPAPKKSKPRPNAMVCIPGKLHDVTIKPAKLNLAKRGQQKTAAGNEVHRAVELPKGVTITKAVPANKGVLTMRGQGPTVTPIIKKGPAGNKIGNVVSNPFSKRAKTNGKPMQNMKPHLKLVNPVTIQKPSTINFSNASSSPIWTNSTTFLKNPIKIKNTGSISNLPASITVKRTTQSSNKSIVFMKVPTFIPKPQQQQPPQQKLQQRQQLGQDVPTVELDDDEGPSPATGPSWYIRPEEQEVSLTLEQQNNAEPKPPEMIEITIEDSPVKPIQNKRTYEVATELAITIDDSPVKTPLDENADCSGSDNETSSTKVYNSKKKLEYPKDVDNDSRKTVEIEIDIPPEAAFNTNNVNEDNNNVDLPEVSIVQVEVVPNLNKEKENAEKITQKKTDTVNPNKQSKVEVPSCSTNNEFHTVYQSFIDLCFQLEDSDDMKKIVEKKIKAYYKQVPKSYTESEEFTDMVSSKILAMKASPDKMYLFIKDIVDELNMQRKMVKSNVEITDKKTEESDQYLYGEESEYDTKRQRQIRKLEKTIKKLHRAIQKLEEQEVDFDDEDDSVYLLTERYKERMVRVYAKFCQLTNTKMPSEPRIMIDARPGRSSGPAKRLEKWVNKKVPIGTPLPFPDFHDVLRCVREANTEDKLGWNEVDIMEEARDLFVRCGKKLQRRRQENEWRLAASRIALEIDPAEQNKELQTKLAENRKLAANKETEIFNKYADRQNQLKLEPVEIGDKEAEESPVESEEEEEANDDRVSLEDKDKRKERLRRLLQEKSKKASLTVKENQESKETEVSEVNIKTIKEKKEETTVNESETDTNDKKEKSEKIAEKSQNDNKTCPEPPETLSLSSDVSNDLESDIDELHLLQKLHSGNEALSSTQGSSDSDSPIAISDSLESSNESANQLSDVISIENSSYSESEVDKGDKMETILEEENVESDDVVAKYNDPETVSILETDCSNDREAGTSKTIAECPVIEKVNTKSNNNEYESVEDILLASSDEEDDSQKEGPLSADTECINLRDDLISIDETVVGNDVGDAEKDIEEEANVTTIPNDVSKNDPLSVESNDETKEVNAKVDKSDKLDDTDTKNTLQNSAPLPSREESTQNIVEMISEDLKIADAVESMDVDEPEITVESNAIESIESEMLKMFS